MTKCIDCNKEIEFMLLGLTKEQAQDLKLVLDTAIDSFTFDGDNIQTGENIETILTLLNDQLGTD